MIISRTPLRVSLFGGGSDLKQYSDYFHSHILSFSINKYIYITLNKRFDNKIRVAYNDVELVENIDEIKHDLVRECLRYVSVSNSVEITIISDLPGGTGLGSSSALTVGLLNALYRFKKVPVTSLELAKTACIIEIEVLKKPIGKQDQYATAIGGLNHLQFFENLAEIREIYVNENLKRTIEDNMSLIFTGVIRDGNEILKQVSSMKNMTIGAIHEQVQLALRFLSLIKRNQEISASIIGNFLKDSWLIKRRYSKNITNKYIESIISSLNLETAFGYKLLGAGGGGFLLCVHKKDMRSLLMESDFNILDFRIEFEGTKIIYES
jgi:D-glycero-alpha-D-manno-heptose-7-phosphate kinase